MDIVAILTTTTLSIRFKKVLQAFEIVGFRPEMAKVIVTLFIGIPNRLLKFLAIVQMKTIPAHVGCFNAVTQEYVFKRTLDGGGSGSRRPGYDDHWMFLRHWCLCANYQDSAGAVLKLYYKLNLIYKCLA